MNNVEGNEFKIEAVVFFARDFLSLEFPKLRKYFSEYKRIYLTVDKFESQNVKLNDADGKVINLNNVLKNKDEYDSKIDFKPIVDDRLFNRDRYLRNYDSSKISDISNALHAVCAHIQSEFNVAYYFDEPVSGYPNGVFNAEFRRGGAICLHFQTAWLPGFMFFVEDFAQDEPVTLHLSSNVKIKETVAEHVRKRKKGLAKPLYVSNYSAKHRRIIDIILLSLKVIYRFMFRRDSFYLDRDSSSHRLHINCLFRSLVGIYSDLERLRSENAKFVLFPLHYEPESILSYFSPFLRQEEVAARILDSLPLGYKLILKEHPSQPGALFLPKWKAVRCSDRVEILAGSVDVGAVLTALDVIVVTIGSTLGLEAALAGRPVGVLGDVHYAAMPGVSRLSQPEDWVELIDSRPVTENAVVEWYADFLESYCLRGTFMRGKTEVPEFDKFVSRLREIRAKDLRS